MEGQHVVEKAVILSEKPILGLKDFFPEKAVAGGSRKGVMDSLKTSIKNRTVTLDEMEKELIKEVMRQHDGNLSAVSQQLGITRQTLYNKLKKYGM